MQDISLLTNGSFHVALTVDGAGFSRWKETALTRWHEDAVLGGGGTFLYVRDAENGHTWSPTLGEHDFDAVPPQWSRVEHEIESSLLVAVAAADDVELRRLRLTNRSSRPRTLSVTSCAEVVLSPPAADSAHPAFSKLFVETQIDAGLRAVIASRRPGKPEETRSWFFQQAIGDTNAGAASFETDRARFVGRGRDANAPAALDHGDPLGGHDGPVLDAVSAIRVPIRLEPGASCTVDWFTGIAAERPACEVLARQYATARAGDLLLESAASNRSDAIGKLHLTMEQARRYERLADGVVHARPALRAAPSRIAANRAGQPGLWAFGISGDVPVVLARIGKAEHVEVARDLIRAHAFWAAHGLLSELMVLVAATVERAEPLLDALHDAVTASGAADRLDKRNGVFLHAESALRDEDRTLLDSVARIVIDAEGGTLAEQLERALDGVGTEPAAAIVVEPASAAAVRSSGGASDAATFPAIERVDFNGFGGLSPDLREYVIDIAADAMTPAPWVNVIANAAFGTLISESGSATTWSENAHEFRLTPWSNDPVSDPSSEAFYIRDEDSGRFWSPTLLPTRGEGPYRTRHGFGYSTFLHEEAGIASELRVFVAADAPIKYSEIILRNRSGRARRLSVTGIVDWVLGDERAKTLMQIVSERDASGAVFARNAYNTDFSDRTAFFDVEGVDGDGNGNGADVEACGDRGDFYGRGGTRAAPVAMRSARLSGRLGAALDPCAALRVAVELPPGAERRVVFRLGCGKNPDEARELVARGRDRGAADAALAAVKTFWTRTLGAVTVKTPEPTVDALANGWLLYQVIGSRLWGRTAFYQSSGAYGYRDQLQDVMALVHARPALVREHLLRAAARQFVEGDVQHWWHPPSGKGIRTRCSDDYLWLPFVASRYVEATGDVAVLDSVCAFLQASPLKEGEASNYSLPAISDQSASLYEHCVRAIRNGLRYGAHGLPLMGAGDWNDGMDQVGAGGRGESVWLGFFLVAVLKRFVPLARQRADTSFAELCDSEAAKIGRAIEATSWDGAWYRRAFFDDGTSLGSADNAECQIDSISQSWSVLSKAAPGDRARQAMQAVDQRLVHRDTRLIQLLDPPFDTSKPTPGYIQGYVPGIRENGGQYTHGVIWAAIAFAELGDGERAWELFGLLNPLRHGATADGISIYKVEPYVVAGDVYAFLPHAGRGGWTWYSGSAGWMYRLLVESLLGLQRRGDSLRVQPLLPESWPGFDLRYRFGETTYAIACRSADSSDAAGVSIDGVAVADGTITLVDDGKEHAVVVDVWRDERPDNR